ncbi:hypothetical protein EsDP_00002680 [Epichloe bromicola]|uniref:TNT domain-containing protein n=1 Tax=Epichloe bromicola TaxID=79588 RepID=A0ABQ0CM07_9HYPO
MMIIKSIGVCLGLWALGANAAAIPGQPDCGCKGTISDSSLVDEVFCGDQRLGPVDVHATRTIDLMTKAWSRLGGLCPGKWLEKWTTNDGRFVYPGEDGFQLDEKRTAVKQAAVLCPGTLVDRFGGERGAFLSPAGMPYEKRSVPPQNLVTVKEPNSPLFNYHVYMVVKEMPVTAGCVAPWFDQPGLGIQYMMNGSVSAAIESGFLKRVELNHDSLPKSDSRAKTAWEGSGGKLWLVGRVPI